MANVITRLLSKIKSKNGTVFLSDCDCADVTGKIYVRELTLHMCINLIANMISKCEIKTYSNGKIAKEEDWYLWNIEPNRNQSKFEFMHELVTKLLREGECLVLVRDWATGKQPPLQRELLIAESFTKSESSTTWDKFTNIKTRGDKDWNNEYSGKEVLYFKIRSTPIENLLAELDNLYAELFKAGISSYKKGSGEKYKYSYDTIPPPETAEREAFDALVNKNLKSFVEAVSAVQPIGKGQDLTLVSSNNRASSTGSRDIKALVGDVLEATAMSLGIPLQFFTSSVDSMDGAYKQLMTNCITPVCGVIETEAIRKIYKYEGYVNGNYIEIDPDDAVYHDIFEVATSVDKLVASSAMCVNDIRMRLGEPIIDEPWAWQHWITKNYSNAEDAMDAQGSDAS